MATGRAFSHTSAAPSQTRWRSSVVHAAVLIGMLACVIGVLILDAEWLSKSTDRHEPTAMNLVGR
jgi:hypothetical protein